MQISVKSRETDLKKTTSTTSQALIHELRYISELYHTIMFICYMFMNCYLTYLHTGRPLALLNSRSRLLRALKPTIFKQFTFVGRGNNLFYIFPNFFNDSFEISLLMCCKIMQYASEYREIISVALEPLVLLRNFNASGLGRNKKSGGSYYIILPTTQRRVSRSSL